MSVIYCFACGNHSDTDYFPCVEAVNDSTGEVELICESCAEALEDNDLDGYSPVQDSEPDESMDGDFDSGMASAGFGTDEDYGYYGDDYSCFGSDE